ncbi:MAG: PSD1 and planctomycete cytochrome C domain-containing protein [Rhodopirellula sp. JB044]|uniref:PSD1 and planctomycete cytochrome C domain-containing protein n=1 Tax=Rhodopirellula sp. JB044 TaxID=3342844 RepID=UPI00370C2A97
MLVFFGVPSHADNPVSFNRDIRPLLSSRCFACHGPDPESRESGLRLDVDDDDDGPIGFVIEPGSIDDSELWRRITTDDESELMPPTDSHLEPFKDEELQLIRRWIESGAEYEGFWAFAPPQMPELPLADQAAWGEQPIDRFVFDKLQSEGLEPSATADPRTLIRRVTFDLTGLPPTREEIAAFLHRYRESPEEAWHALVDNLLSRPQYGEHVGRYWLDLVRYADSNGMHKDFYRNHYAYRDWVIRAFNENLRYDDFLTYQLAGDLYPDPTRDQLIASGFHRLHLIIDRGTALPEESFSKNVIDRVTSVGTAFLGLTIHCAQCHDHKFDPISQKDFYSLSAFFNNIDAAPETVSRDGPEGGLQPPFISLATDEQTGVLREFDQTLDRLNGMTPSVKKIGVKEAFDTFVDRVKQERDKFDHAIPKAMVMKERSKIRPTYILERGQYDAPGEEVTRDTPGFLPPLDRSGDVASRMDLARWFVSPDHPLTARVAVNRFWQQFFGVGLVKTSEDLGSQGEVPSHPELLDYLAVTFMQSGWDVKAVMREIVLSKTYRQSSVTTPEQFNVDPENRLLARGPRYRLDAEMIRDQILATSGLLSDRMYGPSVKPPQPDGLWQAVSMIGEVYQPDSGEAIRRRSVYTFWKRSMPPPQMTILNAPLRDSCIARRERTNTPTQALLLLNEPEYLNAARSLAKQAMKQPESQRIAFLWETVTSRLPDAEEVDVCTDLLHDLADKYASAPNLALQMAGVTTESAETAGLAETVDAVELAVWTVLGNLMFNLDITKTKE